MTHIIYEIFYLLYLSFHNLPSARDLPLDRSQKIGNVQGDKALPIILKLISYAMKDKTINSKKSLKSTEIFISEDMKKA